MKVWKLLIACVVLACSVAPLSGEQRTFFGGGDHRPYPSLEMPWDRPAVGTLPAGKALWESTSFYVEETGLYEFRHSIFSPFDPGPHEFPRVLFLYAQEFDPARPQKNLLGTLDLSDGCEEAEVSWPLLAHSVYHLVLSTVGESKPLDSDGNNLDVLTVLEGPGKIMQSSCRFTDDIDNDADNELWSAEASFVSLRSEGFEQICARVDWWEDGAESEINFARVSPLRTEDSALFYFFDPENWEINLKVLDGCAINGHYWVLASSSTDVRFRIEMSWLGKELFPDEESPYFVPSFGGSSLVYEHPGGGPASAFIDVLAFHCDRPF